MTYKTRLSKQDTKKRNYSSRDEEAFYLGRFARAASIYDLYKDGKRNEPDFKKIAEARAELCAIFGDTGFDVRKLFNKYLQEKEISLLEDIQEKAPPQNNIEPSKKIFLQTKQILSKYLDTSELNLNLLSIWILGTYFHSQFETYPLLTLMARKQSGKTRTLKLCSVLSHGGDGSTSTSLTEAALFRHKQGAVFFDEMESISSKDKSTLRELINAVYKKGCKVTRYRKVKKDGAESQEEENFYPFYPLGMANIYGFSDVLADRSLQLILQRSSKAQTRLIEDFSTNTEIRSLKNELNKLIAAIPEDIFSEWNNYIQSNEVNVKLRDIFESIAKTNLSGRPLEIFFPLFVVSELFGVLPLIIESSQEYMGAQEGAFVDNIDDLLQNFIETRGSEYVGFVDSSRILSDFRASLEEPEEYMNSKWFGRALKRLGFVKSKRLVNGRVQIELNINSTNTTNTPNTTNTTNSTTKSVEYVDYVERKGLVDKNNTPKNRCSVCGKFGFIHIESKVYCRNCAPRQPKITKVPL